MKGLPQPKPLLLVTCTLIIVVFSCKKKDYKKLDCSSTPSKYSIDIAPIISTNCVSSGCHGSGSFHGDFSTYTGVKNSVDAGNFENTVLYKQSMPPSGPLTKDQRQKIYCWIQNGSQNNWFKISIVLLLLSLRKWKLLSNWTRQFSFF